MATLYAKAAGGNWTAAGTWSNVNSAGGDSSGPPTAADIAIFEAGSGNVTVDAGAVARAVDCQGGTGAYTGTLTHTAGVTLTIGDGTAGTGNRALRLSSGMTYTLGNSATSALAFVSTSSTQQEIITTGKTCGQITWNGAGGSWILGDALTSGGTTTVTAGALSNANNFTVTQLVFVSTGAATRSVTLGSATWNLSRTTAGASWSISGSGLTFSGASATLVITTASTATRTFAGNGLTYGTLTYTVTSSPGELTVTGANTFTTVNVGAGRVVSWPSSTTNTVTNLNAHGVDHDTYVYLPGVSGNYISTPDSGDLSITGDITIDARVAMDDWTPAASQALVAKYQDSTQRSYLLILLTGGTLRLAWSPDGTVGSTITKDSTAATGVTDGAVKWVRATLDVDDGSGNNVVKFYTSDDGSSWVQLGSTVTTAGTTSIFDSTAALNIGGYNSGTSAVAAGKVYQVRIYADITQTDLRLDANLADKAFGANTWEDAA